MSTRWTLYDEDCSSYNKCSPVLSIENEIELSFQNQVDSSQNVFHFRADWFRAFFIFERIDWTKISLSSGFTGYSTRVVNFPSQSAAKSSLSDSWKSLKLMFWLHWFTVRCGLLRRVVFHFEAVSFHFQAVSFSSGFVFKRFHFRAFSIRAFSSGLDWLTALHGGIEMHFRNVQCAISWPHNSDEWMSERR